MNAVTSSAGVTSNAGFHTSTSRRDRAPTRSHLVGATAPRSRSASPSGVVGIEGRQRAGDVERHAVRLARGRRACTSRSCSRRRRCARRGRSRRSRHRHARSAAPTPAAESEIERDGDAGVGELPSRETRALQQRTRLRRDDLDRLAGFGLRVDDAERGPDPGRREPSGVAVRHHARAPSRALLVRTRRCAGTTRGPRRGSRIASASALDRRSPAALDAAAATTRSHGPARFTAVGRAVAMRAASSSSGIAVMRDRSRRRTRRIRRWPAHRGPRGAGSRRRRRRPSRSSRDLERVRAAASDR